MSVSGNQIKNFIKLRSNLHKVNPDKIAPKKQVF